MSRTFSSWARRGRRTDTRGGRARGAPRPRSPRRRRRRRPAARARRSGCGDAVSSIAPSRIARATTADSSRSARNFGKILPFETECSSCPARPTRCSPSPPTSGSPPARRGRPRPCRYRARATRSRRGRGCARPSGAPPPAPAARGRAIRGAPARAPRRRARSGGGRAAPRAPVVDEHDRRAVLTHELEDRRVDRGQIDRLEASTPGPISTPSASGGTERCAVEPSSRMSSSGTTTSRSSSFRIGVDQLDLPPRPGDEAADLRERALGRGEADPLERPLHDTLEALEREREMGAALRPRDCVHLVEDHGLDPAQGLRAPAR